MGTTYMAVCRTCGIYRCLDKFYWLESSPQTRNEALKVADAIREIHNFRSALALTFLWDHREHDARLCNEHDDHILEGVLEEPVNWWNSPTWNLNDSRVAKSG